MCILVYMYVLVYVCTCMCCVCMGVYTCIYVYMCLYVFVVCYSDADLIARSEPVTEDTNPIRIHVHYGPTGNSKINMRDDSEIRTGSCRADLIAIRTQNRVISREYLLCIII